MTPSKVIVTIGCETDLTEYAKEVGAEYRPLEPFGDSPEHELYRIHKYQELYDQVLFVGDRDFKWTQDLFKYQEEAGTIIRDGFALFILGKASPRIFEPVFEKVLTLTEIRNLIDSRINAGLKPDEGAGAELAKIFAWLGFPGCQRCARTARTMNMRGTDWCRENYEYLIGVITNNVKANGIEVNEQATDGIKAMLTIAIERADGTDTVKQQATLVAAKVYLAFRRS